MNALSGRRGVAVLALLLCAGANACDESGTGPEVSDTEIWRLELEQTDDGSSGGDVARRRGTIHLTLRLNHTTQTDPACSDATDPTVTTFIATVDAVPSRLQAASGGSANGSWNCFGFAAEVRLDDGTTFTLGSESLPFDPERPVELATPMRENRWAAGARSGYFLLAPEARFAYEPFDSHLDVRTRNGYDEDVEVSFIGLDSTRSWRHHDLEYQYDRFPLLDRAITVPAGETRVVILPSQPVAGSAGAEPPPFTYRIWVRFQAPAGSDSYGFHCLMGPERQWEAELIVHEPGHLECSTGWLGSIAIFPDPRRLFVRPGENETFAISTYDVGRVMVESREPTITTRVVSFVRDETSNIGAGEIAVTVAPDAPRREHSILITGEALIFEPQEVLEVLPIEVYDLSVMLSRDTITVPAGATATANVRLVRDGLLGLDVALSIGSPLPPGVFLVPPTFSPAVTDRDSSQLTLRVDPTASAGVHPLTVCATIPGDPRERCHFDTIVLVVTERVPPYDLLISTTASNDVMTLGQEVFFNVLIGSLGGTVSTGVVATDQLPEGFTYLRHEASRGSYAPATGEWTIGTIDAGPPTTLRVYARADQLGEHTNVAALTAGINGDNNAANNVDSVTVTVVEPSYDLEVTKTVDRATVAAGDTVRFTLTATNHGPAVPQGVAVLDVLPAGLQYVSDDGAGAYSAAIGLWSPGNLPPGTTRTLRIRAVATATATNTATIVSESARDGNEGNDRAEARVVVIGGS